MQLKNVVLNQKDIYGNMMFAGAGEEVRGWINGTSKVVGRSYYFYSDFQKADALEVRIPVKAGIKDFEYEQPIALVNPRIELVPYVIAKKAYVGYKLTADDIVSAEDYHLLA